MINDENAVPEEIVKVNDRSSSISSFTLASRNSTKLASKVFGDLVEDESNSLCYSPSPLADRQNRLNRIVEVNSIIPKKQTQMTPKVFSFDGTDLPPATITTTSEKKQGLNTSKPDCAQPATSPTRKDQSINQSLNKVREAKIHSHRDKQRLTARIRNEWRASQEEASAYQAEVERVKREVIELKSKMHSQFSRAKVEREQRDQRIRRGEVEHEIEFKSMVFRDHKKRQKEEEDKRRRKSVNVKAKIRMEQKLATHKMRLEKIQEEKAIIDARHESSIGMREYEKAQAERRRESLMFRNGAARKIRQLHNEMERKQKIEEHASFELKWAGEKDAVEYKRAMEENRKKSLQFRHEDGKRQRDVVESIEGKKQAQEHESYELKWAGEKDAERYKEFLAEQRRTSFQFRHEDSKRKRDVEEQLNTCKQAEEHEDYELKRAGEKDVEEYKKDLAEKRRKSSQFRHEDGKRQRDVEEKLNRLQRKKESESYELKWEGEKDAEGYRRQMAVQRRKSLQFRNEDARQKREREEQIQAKERQQEHYSYELKWAGEKDAEEYKKQQEEEHRKHLQFRHEDGKRQRDVQEQIKTEERRKEHESNELKWAGEKDAEKYAKQQEEERRKSFQFRHEDGKRQRDVEDQLRAEEKEKEHENNELKWAGEKDVEKYKRFLTNERRKSLQFRNENGRKQRYVEEQVKHRQQQEEHENFELKWAGEQDAESYKKKLTDDRRNSFAFRNQEGKSQREIESMLNNEKQIEEHESYELKWAGEKDAEAYRAKLQDERRNSLAARNEDGKRQRDLDLQNRSKAQQDEHESYELKWAGEKDVEAYKKTMEQARRDSFALKNQENRISREVEEQLEIEKRQNEHESYELKWAGEKDAQSYQKKMQDEQRESFALRNQEGNAQKKMEEELTHRKQQLEHESYELKWAGEKDAEAYKRKMQEERRESFASRNENGRRIRVMEESLKVEDLCREHESYELKWAGEKDAEAYMEFEKEKKRQSLEFRNQENRIIREVEKHLSSKEKHDEHESYKLKWAGEKDAEEYMDKMKNERRESFEFRNFEASRQRAVMNELLALVKEKEAESMVLKWAGEDDAKAYEAEKEKNRRDSFALRNQEGRIHREIDAQIHQEMIKEQVKEGEIQAACQKDVEAYKKDCAEKDRADLRYRGEEAQVQRLKLEHLRLQEKMIDEKNKKLESLARDDVKEYVQECKRKKRMSLAGRAKERRRHAEWEKIQEEEEMKQRHQDTLDRALDSQFVQLAKEKERMKAAMDSLQHPDCTFVGNPFAALLD